MSQTKENFLKSFITLALFVFTFCFTQTINAQDAPSASVPRISDLSGFFKDASAGLSSIPDSTEDTFTATIAPENPDPNTKVYIDLADYSTDLDRATISWFLNDKNMLSGVGKKSFSFSNGNVGQTTKVKVTILTAENRTIEKTFSFTPSSLSLLAEVRAYTPPFYKGRAIFATQGTLHVVALPEFVDTDGNYIDPSKLIYKWKRNGQLLNDVSGYGKNVVDISEGVPLGAMEITVDATSFDNALTANARLVLSSQDPKVLFYEKDPLYGYLFNHALFSPFSLTNNEVSITAFPYFFTGARSGSTLTYDWSMNDSIVSSGANDTMIFKNTTGDSGTSQISVTTKNPDRIFQFTTADLTINYSKPQNNSLTNQ